MPNPASASLVKRGRYPSGRKATKHWTLRPQRGVSVDEGIRLSDQLRSASSYGGPACPRRRRVRTKAAEDLHDLCANAGERPWFEQRTSGQQAAHIGAYICSAGLTAQSAGSVLARERQRQVLLRAEAKRKRIQDAEQGSPGDC